MTPARSPRQRLSEEDRRTQILQACLAVVAAQGYARTSLSAVATQAGVSKGLVSHYFGGHDTLMEQTARAALVELRTAVVDDLDLAAPVPQIIRSAVHRVAHLPKTHATQLAAIGQIVLNLRDAQGTPRLDLDAYEETYAGQEELFRRGQREGDLRQFDTRVMAVTYQSAVDAMLTYLAKHPQEDPDRYADELTALLLNAMRA